MMSGESNHRHQRPSPLSSATTRGLRFLLLISFQLSSATASSPHSRLLPNRVSFYPRGGARSSSSSAVLSSSRRKLTSSTSASSRLRRKPIRKTARKKTTDLVDNYSYNPPSSENNEDDREPTLEELRAQLGPIGTIVSNSVELAVLTLGSYISGGALGFVGGGVMGVPSTLFGREMGSLPARLSALNSKAFASCKSWGGLSAAFSGFNNLVKMCRGGAEDSWNAVWGSAMTGAFLNRAGGPQAMISGGASYAGFTYVLDKFFATGPAAQREERSAELMYTDVPLDD